MKRFIAMMLLLCLMPVFALAEANEAGDVVVSLPGVECCFRPIENGYLLTRESSASVFNRLGMSQRETLPYMEECGVYAMMYDADLNCEVQIIAYETIEPDFDQLTEREEKLLCGRMAAEYAGEGYDVQDVSLYSAANGHKFVRSFAAYTYEDGSVVHRAEYLTCQAGYMVLILLFPYEGAPTEANIVLADRIADSMRIRLVGTEAEVTMEGIRIRMVLPEDVTLLTGKDSMNAWDGLDEDFVRQRRKDMSLGWLQGVIAAPDGSWEIGWTLLKGDGGNLDYLTDEAAQRHCQDLMDTLSEEGNTVTGGESCWLGAHRYAHLTYEYVSKNAGPVQAEEYYTRQDGWNVTVSLQGYRGADLTEPRALLEEIIASQRITVE